MSNHLPVTLDVSGLVRREAEFEGSVPIGQFKRLSLYLTSDGGFFSATMRFTTDANGKKIAVGHMRGELLLSCQRCLDVMAYPFDSPFCFGFVETEEQADKLPDEYDPMFMDDRGKVHVVDLFEDELILMLPQAARHESDQCEIDAKYSAELTELEEPMEAKPNPFSVLKCLNKT